MKYLATLVIVAAALTAGCSSRDNDLEKFIAQTKLEQPSGVAPLPEVKPYESYFYAGASQRSPFVPGGARTAARKACGRTPSATGNSWSSFRSTR